MGNFTFYVLTNAVSPVTENFKLHKSFVGAFLCVAMFWRKRIQL